MIGYIVKPLQAVQQAQAWQVPHYAGGIVIRVVWRTGVMAPTGTQHNEPESTAIHRCCNEYVVVTVARSPSGAICYTAPHVSKDAAGCSICHAICRLPANLCRKAPVTRP